MLRSSLICQKKARDVFYSQNQSWVFLDLLQCFWKALNFGENSEVSNMWILTNFSSRLLNDERYVRSRVLVSLQSICMPNMWWNQKLNYIYGAPATGLTRWRMVDKSKISTFWAKMENCDSNMVPPTWYGFHGHFYVLGMHIVQFLQKNPWCEIVTFAPKVQGVSRRKLRLFIFGETSNK